MMPRPNFDMAKTTSYFDGVPKNQRVKWVFWIGVILVVLNGFALVTQFSWGFNGKPWTITVETIWPKTKTSSAQLWDSQGNKFSVPGLMTGRVKANDRVEKASRSFFFKVNDKLSLIFNYWSLCLFFTGLVLIVFSFLTNAQMAEQLAALGNNEVFLAPFIVLILLTLLFGFDLA